VQFFQWILFCGKALRVAMVIQGVLREAKAGKDRKEFRGLAAASSAEMPWVLLKGAGNAQAYGKFDRIGERTE